MKRFRVSALAAASCLSATVLLAGCSGSSDLAVQNPQIQPTVDANGEVTGGVQNPVNQPGMPVEGQAGEGLPNAIAASDAPDPGKNAPDGFSAKQLKSAFQWSTAFVQQQYMLSGFWNAEQNRAVKGAASYAGYEQFLSPEMVTKLQNAALTAESVAANEKWLNTLAPYPPDVQGAWLGPAVADFAFGKPKYEQANGALTVTFPYSAYGAYVAEDGKSFYAVLIEDKPSFTLVPGDKQQPWRLAGWVSNPKYAQPEKLDSQPVSRIVPDFSWMPDGDEQIDVTPGVEAGN